MAMISASTRASLAALVAAFTVAACSSSPQAVHTAPQPSASNQNAAPSQSAASQSEAAAMAQAKKDSLTRPYTQADINFMTGMIAHHAQALVMAAWAPTHGASPSVQTLCARIINAQRDEIRLMQAWLRDRGSRSRKSHPAAWSP